MPFNQKNREFQQFLLEYEEGYKAAKDGQVYKNPYEEDKDPDKYEAYREGYASFNQKL